MKNGKVIEKFLTWKALPTLITIGILLVSFVTFIVTISNKVVSIEQQHTRIENKVDDIYKFLIRR